ncbi:MAG: hypothetical protein KC503_33255 [Myxococcales bacterium]|nr:hypothetical protein [Myxococcales bacterium]
MTPVADGASDARDLQVDVADLGADAPTCQATCNGCCQPDDTCVAGTADNACGAAGSPCANCTLVNLMCGSNYCQGCTADCASKRCGASDGCGGSCQPGSGCCTPSCSDKTCGTSDGCGGSCSAGSGCHLLYDDFNTLDTSVWAVAVSTGASAAVASGELRITLPAAANAYADVATKMSFGPTTTLEARVYLSAGQFYDHRGLGFANARIGDSCGASPGERDAAQWRGQDDDLYRQSARASQHACTKHADAYAAGWHTIKIVRSAASVAFYLDGQLAYTEQNNVPSASLPVRFSAYTFTSAPGQSLQIRVDWVRVTP